MRKAFLLVFCLLMASFVFADVELLYPVQASIRPDSSFQAGFVSPGQVFELVFSDNSGEGFEWDSLLVDKGSFPKNWVLDDAIITDTSLGIRVKVPASAQPNIYLINLVFSSSKNSAVNNAVEARITVKQNLIDVSFSKDSEDFSVVNAPVFYRAVVTNTSIAPHSLRFNSSMPKTWFEETDFVAEPNSSKEVSLVVTPKSYGSKVFSFQAFSNDEKSVIASYSSELKIRPTLKGKLGSALNGFPFFTFSLAPFQLANSFVSLLLP